MPKVVLCADSTSAQMPELLGLADERLQSQEWMRIICSGEEARRFVRQTDLQDGEVWVASSDDVDAINLAAMIKHDSRRTFVRLIDFEGTGSLKSRAAAAGIDEVLNKEVFLQRYAQIKQHFVCEKTQTLDYRKMAEVAAAVTREEQIARSTGESVRRAHDKASPLAQGNMGDPSRYRNPLPADYVVHRTTPPSLRPAEDLVAARRAGYTLAVVGAGGGVGKSTVAVLSACFARGLGLRTVLVDANLQFGDSHNQLGEDNPVRLDDLIAHPDACLRRLTPAGKLPCVVAPPKNMEDSEALEEKMPEVMNILAQHFDVVVVSMGPVWTEGHLRMLERCSNTLFVMDQRPASIRACRHALSLCTRSGIAVRPFLYAINKCTRSAPYTSIDVSCALQGVPVVEFSDGGRVVDELMGVGRPFDLIDERNALCVSLERFLATILPAAQGTADSNRPTDPPMSPRSRRLRLPHRRRKAACL